MEIPGGDAERAVLPNEYLRWVTDELQRLDRLGAPVPLPSRDAG